jgi:hypothetical protein
MVSAISNATETQPVAQSARPPAPKPTQTEPPSTAVTDTIQLSKAAQALVAGYAGS